MAMNFKRLLIRYWWFLVLLIVAGFFLVQNFALNVQSQRDTGFEVDEIDKINRVVILKGNIKLILEQVDDRWEVNNTFQANTKAIESLMRVASRLQPAAPVPIQSNDSLIDILENQGVLVQFYANKRTVKSYYLHSTGTQELQTVGLLEKSKTAYRLELPNFDGEIIELFKLNPAYWRAKQLDIPTLDEIDALEVETPNEPENAFRIDFFDQEEPRLFAMYYGKIAEQYDTVRVHQFIHQLLSVTFNQVETNLSHQEKGAIFYSEPDYIYTFYKSDGKDYNLRAYSIPVDEYLDEFGRPVKFDLNRMYLAQSSDTLLYIVNYVDFFPVLKDISFFNPIF